MDRWERDLDRWLTTPPEPVEIHAGNCEQCEADIFAGDEVIKDYRTGFHFCDGKCLKAYLLAHIDDEIEEFVRLLLDSDASKVEAEPPEDDYDDYYDRYED